MIFAVFNKMSVYNMLLIKNLIFFDPLKYLKKKKSYYYGFIKDV